MGAKCAALNNYIDMKHEWKYNYIKMIAGKGRTNRLTAKKYRTGGNSMIRLQKAAKKDRDLLWNLNQKYLYEMTNF